MLTKNKNYVRNASLADVRILPHLFNKIISVLKKEL